MRSIVGDVQKKRPFAIALTDKLDGVIRIRIGRIKPLFRNFENLAIDTKRPVTRKEICRSAKVSEVPSKSSI